MWHLIAIAFVLVLFTPTAFAQFSAAKSPEEQAANCNAIVNSYADYYLGNARTGNPTIDGPSTLVRAYALAESPNAIIRGQGVALLGVLRASSCIR
jgi:hypothetical protein